MIDDPLWVFGYGSLIWRPAFRFEAHHDACLHGFARRFWQGSTDHRGVPGAPGRVVTLVPDPRTEVWGRVYRVTASERADTLARLDQREQGGYERRLERVYLREPQIHIDRVLVFFAGPGNPEFLGAAPAEQIAEQIVAARGPSGTNLDYLLTLDDSLREMGVRDAHVAELATLARSRTALLQS